MAKDLPGHAEGYKLYSRGHEATVNNNNNLGRTPSDLGFR